MRVRRDIQAVVKKYFGFVLGASVVVLSQSCGSGSGSKKTRSVYDSGAAGEAGQSSGASAAGGQTSAGGAGSGATAGHLSTGDAAGEAGASAGAAGDMGVSTGGSGAQGGATAGGGGSAGNACMTGFADCDSDPTTCETSLSLVTSCGACLPGCNGNHGTVACIKQQCQLSACNTGYADCDKDPSTGCEQSLAANDNCGECGRNCAAQGSTCSSNRCSAVSLDASLPIGSDSGGLNNWALTGSNLYTAGYYGYNIVNIPLDASATSSVWTKATAYIGHQSLIATATDLLWAERGTPSTVLKKAITAAPASLPTVAFTPEYQPTFLRIQGNAFYWASGDYQAGEPGYIYTRSIAAVSTDPGTRIVTVDQGTHGAILSFNVSSDALYWVTTNAGTGTALELRTTPLAGGTPSAVPAVPAAVSTAITDNGAPAVVQIQALGKTVYFNYHIGTSALNGIYSYNVGEAAPTQLVSAQNVQYFAVDATGIYYADQNAPGVYKAPLTGGVGVSISTIPSGGRIVGIDQTFVYFAVPGCCASAIYKIIK